MISQVKTATLILFALVVFTYLGACCALWFSRFIGEAGSCGAEESDNQ